MKTHVQKETTGRYRVQLCDGRARDTAYAFDAPERVTCDRCRKAAGLTFRIEVAPAVFTMPAGKA